MSERKIFEEIFGGRKEEVRTIDGQMEREREREREREKERKKEREREREKERERKVRVFVGGLLPPCSVACSNAVAHQAADDNTTSTWRDSCT
jgi:hypothetical protein